MTSCEIYENRHVTVITFCNSTIVEVNEILFALKINTLQETVGCFVFF